MGLIKRTKCSSVNSGGNTGTAMKYRPTDSARSLAKGTKPLAEAASVQQVLIMMVVHLCRKVMYGVDISHKVGIYIVGSLIVSIIGDFATNQNPANPSYMARNDNFLNVYFVKYSWGWTLLFTGLFAATTSHIIGCGSKEVAKSSVFRHMMATLVWFAYTSMFVYIENRSGICNVSKFLTKPACVKHGFRWKGFDISGHCFLLIWNNLFILEEAKAYLGWEKIKDMLRNEEHNRLNTDVNAQLDLSSGLSKLKAEQFLHLRDNYKRYTPYVRLLFGILAFWVTLWDVMLFSTVLYFHITIEKVVAASMAVLTWFLLYRVIYFKSWSPGMPGEGLFKYVIVKKQQACSHAKSRLNNNAGDAARWSSKDEVPKFMGMPLYGAKPEPEPAQEASLPRKASIDLNPAQYPLLKGSRSRSQSRSRMHSVSKSSLNLKMW